MRCARSGGGSSARAAALKNANVKMKPMQKQEQGTWRDFLLTLILVWISAGIAAYVYSQHQNIPAPVRNAVLPAFLLELALYLAPGFAAVRQSFDKIGPPAPRALLLLISAVLPYCLATLLLRDFQLSAFLLLAGLSIPLCFWFVLAGGSLFSDILFLAFAAAVYLSHVFRHIYPEPHAHVALQILGALMWIRVGIMAVCSLRKLTVTFGFWPNAEEWITGLTFYLFFLPVAGGLAWFLRYPVLRLASTVWWLVPLIGIGYFFGFLWVVCLAEEFFFRGYLQQRLGQACRSDILGLILASIVFGLVHLPFRHFPNWRHVALAGVLGVCCGLAYLRGKSVRASMVTHALVVATWKMFFAG